MARKIKLAIQTAYALDSSRDVLSNGVGYSKIDVRVEELLRPRLGGAEMSKLENGEIGGRR